MGFPRQEYPTGLPFPLPEDPPDPGIEPSSPMSPALAGRFFTTEPPGNPAPLLTGWPLSSCLTFGKLFHWDVNIIFSKMGIIFCLLHGCEEQMSYAFKTPSKLYGIYDVKKKCVF